MNVLAGEEVRELIKDYEQDCGSNCWCRL